MQREISEAGGLVDPMVLQLVPSNGDRYHVRSDTVSPAKF